MPGDLRVGLKVLKAAETPPLVVREDQQMGGKMRKRERELTQQEPSQDGWQVSESPSQRHLNVIFLFMGRLPLLSMATCIIQLGSPLPLLSP